MSSADTKIGAIATFLQRLDNLGKTDGSQLYFRGHSKSGYELKPSVYRNRGWIEKEAVMLKELALRCPADFADGISTFQSLVRMQHYGLPTRLLDITSNPLVALYFACERHRDDEDGKVLVFNFDDAQVKYFDSDTVNVLANLSRRPADFVVPTTADITKFNAEKSIKLLLHDVRQDRPQFEPEVQRNHLSSVICVRPRLENPRIIRQEGAFLLFGCDGRKQKPAVLPTASVVGELIINRDKKKALAEQLETMGVSKATMFPEIDQVASYVRDLHFIPTLNLAKLTSTQRQVFEVLRREGARSVSEVAASIQSTLSAVSRVMNCLSDQRFVSFTGSGQDERWAVASKLDVVDQHEGPAP